MTLRIYRRPIVRLVACAAATDVRVVDHRRYIVLLVGIDKGRAAASAALVRVLADAIFPITRLPRADVALAVITDEPQHIKIQRLDINRAIGIE